MNSGWDLGTIKKVHTRLPDRVFYQCWGKLMQLINAPEEIDPSPHVCRTIVCTMPCDRLAAISLSLPIPLSTKRRSPQTGHCYSWTWPAPSICIFACGESKYVEGHLSFFTIRRSFVIDLVFVFTIKGWFTSISTLPTMQHCLHRAIRIH